MKCLKKPWYVAARSDEFASEHVLVRTTMDGLSAFFRASDGSAVARLEQKSRRFVPFLGGREFWSLRPTLLSKTKQVGASQ